MIVYILNLMQLYRFESPISSGGFIYSQLVRPQDYKRFSECIDHNFNIIFRDFIFEYGDRQYFPKILHNSILIDTLEQLLLILSISGLSIKSFFLLVINHLKHSIVLLQVDIELNIR